jgi:hypothetical protein
MSRARVQHVNLVTSPDHRPQDGEHRCAGAHCFTLLQFTLPRDKHRGIHIRILIPTRGQEYRPFGARQTLHAAHTPSRNFFFPSASPPPDAAGDHSNSNRFAAGLAGQTVFSMRDPRTILQCRKWKELRTVIARNADGWQSTPSKFPARSSSLSAIRFYPTLCGRFWRFRDDLVCTRSRSCRLASFKSLATPPGAVPVQLPTSPRLLSPCDDDSTSAPDHTHLRLGRCPLLLVGKDNDEHPTAHTSYHPLFSCLA